MKELLKLYQDLKSGKQHSFLEEEAFERIIDYFDEKDQLPQAIEAADYAIEQYPYSSSLVLKKADLLIAQKQYKEALFYLEKAELLDTAWESLEADAVSLTDAQRAELDFRIARHERNPSDVIPWEQVRADLFKKP